MAKTYDTYKDSGIAWIGNIPSGWLTIKNKYLYSLLYSGGTPTASEGKFYTEEGCPFVAISDMSTTEYVTETKKYLTEDGIANKNLKILPSGTILYSIYATVGVVSELMIDATISQAMLAIELKSKINKSYYKYNLKAMKDYIFSQANGNTQFNLNAEKVSNFVFCFPPLSEQQAIATYLNKKCGEIDSLISLQEEMISELQAYKQSVITEAVTKGLDSNVPMKDSGVEWIGMIPEGWKIQRLRTLGNCQNGISKGGEYFGDEFDFPFVNYTDAYKNIDVPYPEGRANSTEEDRKQYSLIEGDILFTRTSETIDEIGYASTCTQTIPNAVFSGFLIRFRPTGKELYYGFSKYYFRSSIHRAFFVKEMNLVTRASLSQNLLKNLPTLIPPLSEQQAIASYLDEKTSQIDSLIAIKQEKITELKDYKKSIIYEYVTGKKKV